MEFRESPQFNPDMLAETYDVGAFDAMCTDIVGGAAGSYETIRGMSREVYLFRGMIEEHAETLEESISLGSYSRAAVVEGIGLAPDGEEKDLHRKEFGDLLWYVSRFLESQDVTLGDALGQLFIDNDQQFDGTFAQLDAATREFPRAIQLPETGEELVINKQTTVFTIRLSKTYAKQLRRLSLCRIHHMQSGHFCDGPACCFGVCPG